MMELGLNFTSIHKLNAIICQRYYGHITIVPDIPWRKFLLILANPDVEMYEGYQVDGERATYPSNFFNLEIAIVRNHCLIELCLSQNIIRLRERLVHSLYMKIPPRIITKLDETKEVKQKKTATFTVGSPIE